MSKSSKYNEALTRARKLYGTPLVDNAVLETVFPELKAPDDDEIRDELVGFLRDCYKADMVFFNRYFRLPVEEVIAWVDRQVKGG